MALETATYIADLVATNPTATDPVGQGDDHLRMLKSVLQTTFPNLGGRFGRIIDGSAGYTVLSTDNSAYIRVPTAAGATVTHTVSLPALSSITAGFTVSLDVPGVLDHVILVPTGGASIEGAATHTFLPQTGGRVFYDGTQWRVQKAPIASEGGFGYYLASTLTVSGEATFKGNVSVAGAVQVGGALGVTGGSTFNAAASFSASVIMQGSLRVEGATTMSGAVLMQSTLTVSGQAYFVTTMITQGAAQVGGAFSVGGAASFASTLSVSGAALFTSTVTVSGAATFNTTMSVGGAATLGSTLSVSAASVLNGAVTCNSTLSVSGGAFFINVAMTGTTSMSGTAVMKSLLDLQSGQIEFPATQNASADANTLDDYEEGTWTPAITAATVGNLSVTYSTQTGVYQKVGNTVHCRGRVVTSAFTHTTAAGECRISGVPFTPATVFTPSTLYYSGVTKAGYTQFMFNTSVGSTLLVLRACGTGIAAAVGNITDLPTGGSVDLAFDFAFTV